MTKAKQQVTVDMKASARPVIKVIGVIDDTMASELRTAIANLEAQGSKNALVYVSSPGGQVTSAFDMHNAVKESSLKMSSRVGALCASAATLFICAFDDVEGVQNGMYMIHEPMSGGGSGTEKDLMARAEILKKIKPQIVSAYAAHMGKTDEEIEQLWGSGDYWMNAKEALKMGLIKRLVMADARMEAVTAEEVQELGREMSIPQEVVMTAVAALPGTIEKQNNPDTDMKELKMMAAMLAIANPKFDQKAADEASVIAEMQAQANEIVSLRSKNTELETSITDLKTAAEQEKLTMRTAKVDDKIKAGAIAAKMREEWIDMAKNAPAAFDKVIDTLEGHQPISMRLNQGALGENATMVGDKTLDECSYIDITKSDKSAKILAQLKNDEPELFKKMRANTNTPISELK